MPQRKGVPSIEVTLDKVRHIRIGLNAICDIEEYFTKLHGYRKTYDEIVTGKVGGIEARVILWAGLRHEDPELTLEQVGLLFDDCDQDAVQAAVQAAWEQHLPEKTEGDREGSSEGPLSSTGSSSGPSQESASA